MALTVNERWMGEIVETTSPAVLALVVNGSAPIRGVSLWIDGKLHRQYSPHQQRVELTEPLSLEDDRVHYAYFHIIQSDGNEAWSSPVWLRRK